MALRIATLVPTQRQETLTPHDWRQRVAVVATRAATAARTGDTTELRSALASISEWPDPQRAYQARLTAIDAVMAIDDAGGAWVRAFAVTADELLKTLEQTPAEPTLLNRAGVLLYELGEHGAATALFKAALRLDASLPHVTTNLKQAQALARAPRAKLAPSILAAVRPLVPRARRVAAAAAPTKGLTVSLCMIVKDEEEMLPGCLEAVAAAVDELIIVDTGSTDRTVEIAESFGAQVIHFPWNGSFADARNIGLDAATGDWILYLDADEHLVPEDAAKLRPLLGHTWREGFHLVETNYTGGEEAGTSVTHLALRLFRNRPDYRFEGRIHEQKTGKMPTFLPERFEPTTIRIRHYGYLKDRISAREKSRRNIELLELEAVEAPSAFNAFNLGSEYLMIGDAAKAAAHFDASWTDLVGRDSDWTQVGYAPILASRLAVARRGAGRIADAREGLAVAIEAMPDHTDLHLELALCAHAEGDLEEAERIALRCLSLGDAPAMYASVAGSGTYLALCLLGELAESRGDAQAAEDYFLRSLREHPDYVAPVLPAATHLIARGVELRELREALPLDRSSAALLAGTACLEAGRLDDAKELYGDVLDRQPGNDAARIGLAETLLSAKSWHEAAVVAAAVPAESPLAAAAAGELLFAHAAAADEPALRAALATTELSGVSFADRLLYGAWADFIADGSLPKSLPAAAFTTATTALEALLRVREFESFEALAKIGETIAVSRDDWNEVLAQMYLRRGYLDSAAEQWIAAASERPTARAFVGLAQVALARSLDEDAAVFANHALELDPSTEQARRVLSALDVRAAA